MLYQCQITQKFSIESKLRDDRTGADQQSMATEVPKNRPIYLDYHATTPTDPRVGKPDATSHDNSIR
jgi:hypothetical protein